MKAGGCGYTLLKDLSLSAQRQKTDDRRLMFSLDLVSSGKPSPCAMKDERKGKMGMGKIRKNKTLLEKWLESGTSHRALYTSFFSK